MEERYTHMQHNIRKHFKLSMEEYAVLDAIYCLSRSGVCDAKAEYFINLFDISRRNYFNIRKSLDAKGLTEKVKHGVRSTRIWDDAMAGRVAPWSDPSETKTESEKTEKDDSAKNALPENEGEKVQNLHSEELESAEFALEQCRICTQPVQNLHSNSAEFALLNNDINTVINNDINNKQIEPAGSSAFSEIDKIFQAGSETLTGQPYYKDGKESKHIKSLESRYSKDPEAFINLTRKYYWMITKLEDNFWNQQAFTPSAFNSHYNRILCFQAPVKMQKQEAQKHRTAEDVIWDNYGGYEVDKLKYLLRGGTISQADFDYILKRQTEVSA